MLWNDYTILEAQIVMFIIGHVEIHQTDSEIEGLHITISCDTVLEIHVPGNPI